MRDERDGGYIDGGIVGKGERERERGWLFENFRSDNVTSYQLGDSVNSLQMHSRANERSIFHKCVSV